jgi:hypothetical protein
MTATSQANFIVLSGALMRRFWLVLMAAAILSAGALYVLQLSTAPYFQATATVTFTDWQTERLTKRDDPADKNPANVGGAAADEMSRALVMLKDPTFFQALPFSATAQQLSLEHKRRGNLVTLRWSGNSAQAAETQLAQLIRHWDQQWRQQFIQQLTQQQQALQLLQVTALQQQELSVLQHDVALAAQVQPFAFQLLQQIKAPEQPERSALWLVLVLGSIVGFSAAFVLLMLWRL